MSASSLQLAAELASLVESILEFFKPKALRLVPDRGLSANMRSATDEVLAAVHREDLVERLDELAVSAVLLEIEATPRSNFSGGSIEEGLSRLLKRVEDSNLDLVSLTATLGATPTRQCERGFEAFRALLRMVVAFIVAFSGALAHDPKTDDDKAATKKDGGPRLEPVAWLYDARIPVSLRAGIGRFLRSLASTYAIARAEEQGAKLEPWLALALADSFAEGFVQAQFAAERAALDPASLVMLGETSRRKREQLELLLDQWRLKAAGAGGPYYMSKLGHEAG
jgi:hypothetical protein